MKANVKNGFKMKMDWIFALVLQNVL